jgi:ABC-2 type transport system permease protein
VLSQLGTATLLEVKKIIHDRRRIAILILGPVILCLVFGLIGYYNPRNVDLAVYVEHASSGSVNLASTQQIIEKIRQSPTFNVEEVSSLDDAVSRLKRGLTRAAVVFREGTTDLQKIEITIDVTDSIIQQTVTAELSKILMDNARQSALQTLEANGMPQAMASAIITPFEINLSTNEARPLTNTDMLGSGLIVLFVVGISVIMSSIAVTSERSKGTIERIFASSFSRWVFIGSKALANSIFGIAIALIVWLTLKLAFNITMGNMGLVLLLTALTSVTAIIMGLLISSVTYSESESVLGAVMIWLTSLFLMGINWPLETMHPIFTYVAKLMPFTYALNSLRNVNLVGCSSPISCRIY